MTSPAPSYHGYRFPPEIISHALWLYHRFCLRFRDAEDLLAHRVDVRCELGFSGAGSRTRTMVSPRSLSCRLCACEKQRAALADGDWSHGRACGAFDALGEAQEQELVDLVARQLHQIHVL